MRLVSGLTSKLKGKGEITMVEADKEQIIQIIMKRHNIDRGIGEDIVNETQFAINDALEQGKDITEVLDDWLDLAPIYIESFI